MSADAYRCASGHWHVVPSLARICDARLEVATRPKVAA